jgi:hypothetical protein
MPRSIAAVNKQQKIFYPENAGSVNTFAKKSAFSAPLPKGGGE